MPALRICLLIPTYRRPAELERLLAQCAELAASYTGPNCYAVVVTDSDSANPLATTIAAQCTQYLLNPGKGFDENLLNFYRHHASAHDYMLSISDDDAFAVSDVHPWLFIDAALAARPSVVLFNHVEQATHAQGATQLLQCYFRAPQLQSNPAARSKVYLQLPPRHAGIIYASTWLHQVGPALHDFLQTQHLYVAPFLLACARGATVFVDLPLIRFNRDLKSDGAWENGRAVFDGLLRLLCQLRPYLNDASFSIACQGYWDTFFGPQAWLREVLTAAGIALPPPEEVIDRIEAVAIAAITSTNAPHTPPA